MLYILFRHIHAINYYFNSIVAPPKITNIHKIQKIHRQRWDERYNEMNHIKLKNELIESLRYRLFQKN
jgi:hypothetical protein